MSITIIIIILTCVISFACLNNGSLFNSLAHYPYEEHRQNQKYRWLTSGFVHADFFHLFINMFVLSNFGSEVERLFIQTHGTTAGTIMYPLFYLFMIVLANLPTYSKHKNDSTYRAIGASGAVAAVLFSFIVFHPVSILQLYLFLPIPAVLFGVLYLWYENWAGKKQMDNVGHDAHFFGALAGFIFTIAMKPSLFGDFIFQIKNAII
jgi:membrane associated rhomboid family serine protease